MKHVTEGLRPERVWYYFEEISKIPRCSRHEKRIIRYISDFANDNNLANKRDDSGNIVVVRPASKGYEKTPVVVLQSHVDMVCEKNQSSSHDFKKDPINLIKEGEWIKARDTSLGADNGIGVAIMLSVLSDTSLKAGKIECLFTVEEETGLTGAFSLGEGMISGALLINLDTEEINTIYIGCAGGMDSTITLPCSATKPLYGMKALSLNVEGLKGGHSGGEIHKGRANALKIMGRLLFHLGKSVNFNLADINGGDKVNAIPREASAMIVLNESIVDTITAYTRQFEAAIKNEYAAVEPDIAISAGKVKMPAFIWNEETTKNVVATLMVIPHGVISMSSAMKDLVETSTNCASVHSELARSVFQLSHRSSVESALDWIAEIHQAISFMAGGTIEHSGRYPAWEADPRSNLLMYAKKAMKKLLGTDPRVRTIHAGLECAVIKKRFTDIDVISIGPTIISPHSPDERVAIQTVAQLWEVLREIISTLDDL